MADKYLVPCSCGKSVAVAVNQAGSKVVCECGSQVGVPPLRKLRELPRETSEIVAPPRAWTPRHAVASAGAILAAALAIWGAWQWFNEPAMPKFDQIGKARISFQTNAILEHAKPIEYWQNWVLSEPILLDRGFEEVTFVDQDDTVQYIEDLRIRRQLTFAAAGLIAAISAVVWFFWPKPLV